MPSHIKIYAELHWAVQRPCLIFRINNQVLTPTLENVGTQDHVEKIIFNIYPDLRLANIFEIELHGKTDELVTQDSDHWADVKNIMVGGVPADAMLLTGTEFVHSMSESWVENMRRNGHDIQAKYSPGTSLRLNGVCRWKFSVPFTHQKIIWLWQME